MEQLSKGLFGDNPVIAIATQSSSASAISYGKMEMIAKHVIMEPINRAKFPVQGHHKLE